MARGLGPAGEVIAFAISRRTTEWHEFAFLLEANASFTSPRSPNLLEFRAQSCPRTFIKERPMAKPGRKVKKANHGKRPACSRPRKNRRQKVKT